jgi:hypothetical protein
MYTERFHERGYDGLSDGRCRTGARSFGASGVRKAIMDPVSIHGQGLRELL